LNDLLALREVNDQPIYTLEQLTALVPNFITSTTFIDAEHTDNVRNIIVEGELLSTDLPYRSFDPLGLQKKPLEVGDTEISSKNLHSISLLTAFLQNDQFRQITSNLPDLLGMIFDGNLYYHDPNNTDTPERNFLEHLIRNQEGLDQTVTGDGNYMLDRFTADMQRVSKTVGWNDEKLSKALIAFAMQMYYENPEAANADKELFFNVFGGIRFSRNDVAGDLFNDAKGFYLYFIDYMSENFSNEERALIYERLPALIDWYVPAGNQAMNATAGTESAFMLGGSFFDIMTGGSQADVLLGNGGEDHLYGGADADLLIGGDGIDIYYIEGNDTIVDSGRNSIYVMDENQQYQLLAGGFVQEEGTSIYRSLSDGTPLTFHSPGHLLLNDTDSVTFANQTSAVDFENKTNVEITWRIAA
jgi:hypothetical protein